MAAIKRLNRRAFLRGAGGVAIALPFLDLMRPRRARAGGDDLPRRMVLYFTANGTQPSSWTPGPNFALSPILAPLAAHKERLTVISGLDMKSSGGDRKGHNRGVGCLWTGVEPLNGNDGDAGYGNGISLDQHLANELQLPTKFKTLEFGVRVYFTIPRGRMIYEGPNQPVPPEDSPWKMFNRIFGDFGQDETEAQRIRDRRLSVLDAVKGDFDSLQPRLGAEDKIKLEQHLDAVRELETRVQSVGDYPEACEPPVLPGQFNVYDNDRFPQLADLQMDLLAMALACDMTRIASFMFGCALSNRVYTWLGQNAGHHELSHALSDPVAVQQIIDINTWHAERFATLLDRLEALPEGDGSVLDNTVVCWGSELGQGQPHYCSDIPFVLAGDNGGFFETNQHVTYQDGSHNDLLITLMHSMGLEQNTFGDPAYCNGPLQELMA